MSDTAISRTVSIVPTVEELAKILTHLGSDDQAKLFSLMAEYATFSVPMQLQYVTDDTALTKDGRHLMSLIGAYAFPSS